MKAIILAGGLGTRLRPLTFAVPKPLIPVGERPILEILVENLKGHGVVDIYLAVGSGAELIQVYFQDGRQFGVNIHYSREDKRLGTAGPLRLIRDRFELSEPVLVMNADIMTKLDVQMDGGRIRAIEERPRLPFHINCGIYVVSPDVLDLVPKDEFVDMPDLIGAAVRSGHKVFGYPIREEWVAIESLGDLTEETRKSG